MRPRRSRTGRTLPEYLHGLLPIATTIVAEPDVARPGGQHATDDMGGAGTGPVRGSAFQSMGTMPLPAAVCRTVGDQAPPGARNSLGAAPVASTMADCASTTCRRISAGAPRAKVSGWVMVRLQIACPSARIRRARSGCARGAGR